MKQVRHKWSKDISDIDEKEWAEALASPKEIGIMAGFGLIQLKILHRVYYAPTALFKTGRTTSDHCRRGCGDSGTFYHTVWACPVI